MNILKIQTVSCIFLVMLVGKLGKSPLNIMWKWILYAAEQYLKILHAI